MYSVQRHTVSQKGLFSCCPAPHPPGQFTNHTNTRMQQSKGVNRLSAVHQMGYYQYIYYKNPKLLSV